MGLTREFLKELEIDESIAEKIIVEHGKSIQQEQARYADYDTLKANYENQGKDLVKLQKLDPEKLQEELEKLSTQHKLDIEAMKTAHSDALKKMAVKMQLISAHDPDLVLSQIDMDKIELDDKGNIKAGFDDQFKTLQESKAFLFKPQEEPKVNLSGVKPADGLRENEKSYADRLSEARAAGNNDLAFKIITEAAQNGQQLR